MTAMGPEGDALAAAGRRWLGGRPLEAGKALTALVPPAARPAWAGRIVAWATARAKVTAFPEIAALVAATERAVTAAEATAVRDALETTLAREQASGRFDSLREAILILALNAAHLLVAAYSDAPPDPHEGWWFVASLKCVGDELDDAFATDAWPLLMHPNGASGDNG